jgi:hypothetical protein
LALTGVLTAILRREEEKVVRRIKRKRAGDIETEMV